MSDASTAQSPLASPAASAMGYRPMCTIATNVKDLDASIAWYTDVLGLELLYRVDEIQWCEMKSPVPGVNIGLGVRENPPVTGCMPVWEVADVDSARATLEGKGVRFDGDTQTVPGMVKLATFFDPDGNGYMLSQSLADMG
ncbi:MAG: VOC family protein [Planctomycetota bacterium]